MKKAIKILLIGFINTVSRIIADVYPGYDQNMLANTSK